MKNIVARFVKDESGATAIEYGLIAALIAVAAAATMSLAGGALIDMFQKVVDEITAAIA